MLTFHLNRIFDELQAGELFGRVEFDVNDPDTADVLRLDSLCPGFDLDSNTGEITLRLKSLLLRLLINTLYIYTMNFLYKKYKPTDWKICSCQI